MKIPTLPEQHKTMADRIFHQLKEDIVKGTILQGQRIVEANLAKKYNTSRGPLREALQRLEGVHLIERIPNAGCRVVTIDYEKARQLYQVRGLIEGYAARLATLSMSQADIDGLRSLMESHNEMVMRSDGTAYVQEEGNHDFHYYIFSRCKNDWLVNCITNNIYYLMRMCRLNLSYRTPLRPQSALKEHNTIVDAIENRDADLVEILMQRHIETAWKALEKIIGGGAL
jgi:DNA-binding GntR family transcriptional regulator